VQTQAKKPLVLVSPHPRALWMVFTEEDRAQLEAVATLIVHEDGPMPAETVERHLAEVELVIGQIPLPRERIERAPRLRAVINVKGNWESDVDYAECERRRIPVLSAAPAMAPAVAEACLAFALDLARGITPADRAFRLGEEAYGIAGNERSFLLRGQPMGLVGFGNLGRSLMSLLDPFGGRRWVYDPWLPDGFVRDHGGEPCALDELLAESRVIFILAGVFAENEGFLDRARLERIRPDAAVVLASRAEVVDFPAFVELAQAGRFRAAIDVFPEEPVADDDPVRAADRILLSAHRAGGLRDSYARISSMVVDDALLILQGLPPVRLQRAQARIAASARSR
jgi:phosphoglycerate dehydrogenase-like enzyme